LNLRLPRLERVAETCDQQDIRAFAAAFDPQFAVGGRDGL
jgi:hypothetical protein